MNPLGLAEMWPSGVHCADFGDHQASPDRNRTAPPSLVGLHGYPGLCEWAAAFHLGPRAPCTPEGEMCACQLGQPLEAPGTGLATAVRVPWATLTGCNILAKLLDLSKSLGFHLYNVRCSVAGFNGWVGGACEVPGPPEEGALFGEELKLLGHCSGCPQRRLSGGLPMPYQLLTLCKGQPWLWISLHKRGFQNCGVETWKTACPIPGWPAPLRHFLKQTPDSVERGSKGKVTTGVC